MGNVIGIVAEYNPFHNGHARLIEQTRARLGADCPVVCVMSGDFVQRGSPAVYSKFARAEAAARCGADLVLELPLPWALSSAEGFARGAVGLLGSAMRVQVQQILVQCAFGQECSRWVVRGKLHLCFLAALAALCSFAVGYAMQKNRQETDGKEKEDTAEKEHAAVR